MAIIVTAQAETLAIQEESRPKLRKNDAMRSLGRRNIITSREEKKLHTCVATHTTRDTLFLFLSVGFSVGVKYHVCLFTFGYDRFYGETKDGLLLFFALSFCTPVAVLERGDAASCAIGGVLVQVVWGIIEVFLFCAFSGRGGGRGAVGWWETGGRL